MFIDNAMKINHNMLKWKKKILCTSCLEQKCKNYKRPLPFGIAVGSLIDDSYLINTNIFIH